MRIYYLLSSMKLMVISNCNLLYLHSNETNSLKIFGPKELNRSSHSLIWVKSKMKLPDIRVKQVITLLDVGQEQDEATRYKS